MSTQKPLDIDRPPDLNEQIQEAERELLVRRNVYPAWIEHGRITQRTADYRIAVQAAIVETLKRQREER